MYRRDLAQQRIMVEQQQFISKMASLPVVSSALSTVTGLYQKTKDSNSIINYTLNMAECSVKTVADTAQPIVTRYEDPLKKVNAYACDKLDILTTTYPVIMKPTDELIRDGKEACSNLVKPAVDTVTAIKDVGVGAYNKSVDTVNSVKQYGVDTVAGVTNYGKNAVIGVTNYGKSQVDRASTYGQNKLTEAMTTSTGKMLTGHLSNVLTVSENYVDKYLPPMEDDCDESKALVGEADMLGRVTALKTKVHRRMVKRALKNLVSVRVRSKEVLDKLGFTMNVVDFARMKGSSASDTMSAAQVKFWETWKEITAVDECSPPEGDENVDMTLERRSVLIARRLVSQLRCTISSLQANAMYLPNAARVKYEEVQKFSDDLISSFRNVNQPSDLSAWFVAQTRESISHIQTSLAAMVDMAVSSAPLSWLVTSACTTGVNGENVGEVNTGETRD